MSYESLRSIFVFTGIASLVLAGVALILFFALRIPDAVAYLTGRARRRGIEQIRRETSDAENAGNQQKKPKGKSAAPQKKVPEKKKLEKKAPAGTVQETAITDRLGGGASGTMPLAAEGTMPLNRGQTDVLTNASNLTTVLNPAQAAGTMPLTEAQPVFTDQPFSVEFEITFLTSDVQLDLEV